jgi:hypothetical protein
VLSEPAGATVFIGGRALGVTPWSGELPPGTQQVTLELRGHERRSAELTLSAERAGELRLALPQEKPAPEPPPRATGIARVQPLTWTFLAVGLGAIGGGVAFELSRAASSDRAGRASSNAEAAQARGAADAKQMASLVLLGFGGAFVVGGGVLLALDLTGPATHEPGAANHARAPESRVLVSLPCAPGFCGLSGSVRF